MFKEFKEFALRGNIMDLAVGVIIGGAFQKIVTSLVNDIIMPAISIITGKVDYNDLCFTVGDVSIKYGSFLTTILDFLIIAFSIFLIIRYINKFNKKLDTMKAKEQEKFNKRMEKLNKKLEKNGKINPKWLKKKEQAEASIPEPTTKTCPYCLSEIPVKATRCAHCTSELSVSEENK